MGMPRYQEAAKQLIGHLLRSEVGIPSHPLQTLVTGEWQEAESFS
jgi:hypothetical protein